MQNANFDFLASSKVGNAHTPAKGFFKFASKIEAGKPTGLLYTANLKDAAGKYPAPIEQEGIYNFDIKDLYIKPSEEHGDSLFFALDIYDEFNAPHRVSLSFGKTADLETASVGTKSVYSLKLDLLYKLCVLKYNGQKVKSLRVKKNGTYKASGTSISIVNNKEKKTTYNAELQNMVCFLDPYTGAAPKTEIWYQKKDEANGIESKVKTLGVPGEAAFLPNDILQFFNYWSEKFKSLDAKASNVDPETGEMLGEFIPETITPQENQQEGDLPF